MAPAAALAATLTEVVQVEDVEHQAVVGASPAEGARPAAHRRRARADRGAVRAGGDAARLPAPRPTWLAELTSLGPRRLPRRRHGPGQDRAGSSPCTCTGTRGRAHPGGRRWWCARRPCWATGRPRSGGSPPAYPSGASTAPDARWTAWSRTRTTSCPPDAAAAGDPGFVLTTYGTMRNDAEQLAAVPWGLVVADEAQHVKNAQSVDRPRAAHHPERGPGRADRHPRREQPHRAVGDPRLGDPGAAGQSQRLPQGVGRPHRVGARADQGAPVRRPDRAVPAPPAQVRPGHRPRAAGQDRDRPPHRPDPRAGRPLRDLRARLHAPHRGGRRGHPSRPGAQAAHRAQADLQPPGPLPQAVQPAPVGPLREARPPRRADRHGPRRGRGGAGLHAVRRDGAAARAPPVPAGRAAPVPARRHARRASGRRWWRASRPARCPSSCCRSRPAAPASTSPRPTTSSTSTAGGTPRSRSRPPTGPTGSARPGRSRCTGSSPRARSRRRSPSSSPASARSPTRSWVAARPALTELSNAELRDLVELRDPGSRGVTSP